ERIVARDRPARYRDAGNGRLRSREAIARDAERTDATHRRRHRLGAAVGQGEDDGGGGRPAPGEAGGGGGAREGAGGDGEAGGAGRRPRFVLTYRVPTITESDERERT